MVRHNFGKNLPGRNRVSINRFHQTNFLLTNNRKRHLPGFIQKRNKNMQTGTKRTGLNPNLVCHSYNSPFGHIGSKPTTLQHSQLPTSNNNKRVEYQN